MRRNVRRLWQDFIEIMVAALVIAVVIGGIFGIIMWGFSESCHAKVEDMGEEANYHILAGCRVKVGDRLIPFDQYRWNEEGELP